MVVDVLGVRGLGVPHQDEADRGAGHRAILPHLCAGHQRATGGPLRGPRAGHQYGDRMDPAAGTSAAARRAPVTSKGPGPLVVIGGAEDKIGRSVVLRRFVRLAGGRGNARIVVVPTASSVEPEMVAVYTDLFTRLGATEVRSVRPISRATADDPELAAETATATGIFMTGGNQLKLSQILTGTALGDAIHAAHSRGAVDRRDVGGGVDDELAHDLPRWRGRHAAPPQQPALRRARPHRRRGGRPALRPAQPVRPADVAGGDVAEPARHRHRREHRRGDHREAVDGRGRRRVRCSSSTPGTPRPTRTRPAAGAPLLLSGAVVHTLPAGSRFDLERRTLVSFVEKHPDHSTQVHHSDRDEARMLAGPLARDRPPARGFLSPTVPAAAHPAP